MTAKTKTDLDDKIVLSFKSDAHTIFLILLVFLISKEKSPIGIITLGMFTAIVAIAWAGNKPLPTGRVLLPFWPIIVYSIIEILEWFIEKFSIPKMVFVGLNVLVFGALVWNFQSQTVLAERLETYAEQWLKPVTILANYKLEYDPHEIYYLEKDQHHHILFQEIKDRQITPDSIKVLKNCTIRTFGNLSTATLHFPEKPKTEKLYRNVFLKNEIVYQDTFLFMNYGYKMKNEWVFLLPFPNRNFDHFEYGLVGDNWKESFQAFQ